MGKRMLVAALVAALVSLSVAAGDGVGKLNIQQKDYDMKSAFAKWVDGKKRLDIFVYPFDLDENDKLILLGEDEQAIISLPRRKDTPAPWAKVAILFDAKPSGDALPKVKLFAVEINGLPEEEDILQRKFEKDKAAKFFSKLQTQFGEKKKPKKGEEEDYTAAQTNLAAVIEKVQVQGNVKRLLGEPDVTVTAVLNLNINCSIGIPEPPPPPEKADPKKTDKEKDKKDAAKKSGKDGKDAGKTK